MVDNETTLIIQDIISKAIEGRAQPFRHILYLSEFCYYCRCTISTRIIIKTLTQAAENLFKEYCKDVITGISDIAKLLAYQQLLDIIDFYEDELDTINRMLADYHTYLGNLFNFVDAILGGRREIW
jgi:hypothetical protein